MRLQVVLNRAAIIFSADAKERGMAAESGDGMRTRPIPSSGEALPAVGLGTWQQFDVPAGAAELPALRGVLDRLFAAGGGVIDSSPMYGEAEARLGDLLGPPPPATRPFVATKVWTRGREAGVRQMQRSIALLGGRVDLMQVHNLVDTAAHMPVLREWQAAGRIRYRGLTHYTPSAYRELAEAMRRERPDFVQLAYSLGTPAAEERLLPLAQELGIAVLVNLPFGGGSELARLRGRPLPDWARACADGWPALLLKFVLAHPAVTCVIPGTSDPAHIDANLAAGFGRLPEAEEVRRLRALWASL